MSNPAWVKITVNTSEELLETASSLLLDLGAGGIEEEKEGGVSAYFTPDGVDAIIAAIERLGADLGVSFEVTRKDIAEEDWWDSWKKYFKPFLASPRVYIRPSWEEAGDVPQGAKVLTIDPGRAFGTGAHETTRLCLKIIDDGLAAEPVGNMLDVGVGSGILSIAARLLGVPEVTGVDIDQLAMLATRENAQINGVSEGITTQLGSTQTIQGPFDLVVANILYQVILGLSPELVRLTRPGGRLLVSGFLTQEIPSAKALFAPYGLTVEHEESQGAWSALLLRKPAI